MENKDIVKSDSWFSTQVIVAVIAGLIIGLIAGSYIPKTNDDKTSEVKENGTEQKAMEENASTTSGSAMNAPVEVSFNVGDQKAGNKVLADFTLDNSYWVAIRDDSSEGKASYVLGAGKFQKGSYKDQVIYVSRALVAGKTYEISLYKDAGDFDYKPENLIQKDGKTSVATFKVN